MAYPGSSTALIAVRADADGSVSESFTVPAAGAPYRLGTGLTPTLPSGWILLPKGAYPISAPAAPTSAGAAIATGGNFLSNGTYKWLLTNVTAYGETVAGGQMTQAVGASAGWGLTLPAATQGTSDAPIIARRLYRTLVGGATFYFVRELTLNEYGASAVIVDGAADADITGGPVPPVVNASGLAGLITITSGVVPLTYVEQAPGTVLATGQFIADYSLAGGTIKFAAVDGGKAVTAVYTASHLWTSATANSIINAIKDIAVALGTPNAASGVAILDGSARMTVSNGFVAGGASTSQFNIANATTLSATTLTVGTGGLSAGGHIVQSGALPTSIVLSAAAGVGATASLLAGSTDQRGRIQILTGTGTAAGIQATITFATPFAVAPLGVVSGGGPGGPSPLMSACNFSTTTWMLSFDNAPTATLSYLINYLILG